eukprot:PhF_6_TR17095/c0_g1_i3/m.26286
MTDRALYRPGEPIHARVVFTDTSRRPLVGASFSSKKDSHINLSQFGVHGVTLSLENTKKEKVVTKSLGSAIVNGAVGCTWFIPSELPGGMYTLVCDVETNVLHCVVPPCTRPITIRQFQSPRMTITYTPLSGNGSPGCDMTGEVRCVRVEGSAVAADSVVTFQVRLGETKVVEQKLALTGDNGKTCVATYTLPKEFPKDLNPCVAHITITVQDGGVVEVKRVTVPLAASKATYNVSVYPEGGDVVPGEQCVVYV